MTLKSQIIGNLAYYITSLLKMSMGITSVKHPEYNPHQQYLFAFWHGKQLLPVWFLRQQHHTDGAVLVSPSKDGDILSVWLNKLGYEVIRGSSRDQNISALSHMIRRLKKGHTLGFGIDGPIGPIYKVKPGMTHMAQKFGIPIVPIGSAFSRKWIVEKAWDKYEIPKPFSKAILYVGKPFIIPPGADLDKENERLEQLIMAAEQEALHRL